MPRKKCGLSFSCALMLQQPGLEPGDCPNYRTCGSATELTSEEHLELIRVREQQAQEFQRSWTERQERLRVSRHQAAIMMLRQRGCPQNLESLGVSEPLDAIAAQLEELRSLLSDFQSEDQYIAPEGCEAHRYNVKRSGATYWYNKLTANSAMFAPVEREEQVKVIHLSHDDDSRNVEGRLGVARRNQLTQIRTQLQVATVAIAQALTLLNQDAEVQTVSDLNIVLATDSEIQLEQNTQEILDRTISGENPLPEIMPATTSSADQTENYEQNLH